MTPAALLSLSLSLAAGAAPAADLVEKQAGGRPAVILAPRDGPTGVLTVTFRSGIYDDGDKPGLTRLSQQALIGANEKVRYEDLVTTLYEAGASLELETGVRACTIRLVAPRASFEKLSQKVLSMLLHPALDREELRKAARRLLVEELWPGHAVAISALLARSVFQDDWRVHNDLLVDKDAVETLTFEDLDKHISEQMTPANAQVVVAGPFDRGKMRAFIKRFQGGTPVKPLRKALTLPVSVHFKSRSRVHVMAFPVDLKTPQSVARVRVLAALLEDRLFRRLRGDGKIYSLEVTVQHTEWLDFLMVVVPVGPKPLGVGNTLQEEVAKLAKGDFSVEDLASNRAQVDADLAAAALDPVRLGAQWTMFGPSVPWLDPATVTAVREVTHDDLKAFAASLFVPEKTIYILYGPDDSELVTSMPKR